MPTPFVFGTSIVILTLLTTIIILLALVLRLQALQLRRIRPHIQSPPATVARVPVFFAAPARSRSELNRRGKKKGGKGDRDRGASRRTSTDGEIEEVELDVLDYERGGGGDAGLHGNAV